MRRELLKILKEAGVKHEDSDGLGKLNLEKDKEGGDKGDKQSDESKSKKEAK